MLFLEEGEVVGGGGGVGGLVLELVLSRLVGRGEGRRRCGEPW